MLYNQSLFLSNWRDDNPLWSNTAAAVCIDSVCRAPVTEPEMLFDLIE